jgi:hypothetical protein
MLTHIIEFWSTTNIGPLQTSASTGAGLRLRYDVESRQ